MSERINIPFTNEHFVAFCEKMLGQPYWYGSVVYKCTENLRARKAKQYPAHYGSSRTARYRDDIAKKKVCADCVGLIKGYNWTNGGQLTSYEAQVKHYTEYIKSKEASDNWQFVDVYTDKGITGVSTQKREGFNRMIQDALAGKIDLIITKSVSRFARNTVDTLTAIRKLKEYGVEVYFEEQNIYTLDGKGEVLLTIMSSIAQEESRNISENVTWGMRKRFADGKVTMPYGQFMAWFICRKAK